MLPTFASLTVAASQTLAACSASATVTTLSSAASRTSALAEGPHALEVANRLLGQLERHHPFELARRLVDRPHGVGVDPDARRGRERRAHRPHLLHVALHPDLQLERVEPLRRPLQRPVGDLLRWPGGKRRVALHRGGGGLEQLT